MRILQKIYNEDYTPGKAADDLPFSLRLKTRAFWDALEEGMGEEFLERHSEDLNKIEQFRDYANFREGFRLGVSLMMELM